MSKRYQFEYNDQLSSEFGLYATKYPEIEEGEDDIEELTIPGLDGVLIVRKERREPTTITFYLSNETNTDEWMHSYDEIKKWLRSSGNKRLTMSDKTDAFYKVYTVSIKSSERKYNRYGDFVVEFKCYPYQMLRDGQEETDSRHLYNNYKTSHPIYKITGEGVCTLTVNNKSVKVNVGQNIIIDTERQISYREDGISANTSLSGKYNDIYLAEGKNDITITEGFELKTIPNWRIE